MAFQVTAYRMIIFFFILLIGFVAGKTGIIKKDYMPHLAQIITKILLPVLIFYGTVSYTTRDDIIANWPVIAFSVVFYLVLAALLFGLAKLMRLAGDRDKIFTFAFLFGNTGFVGIPLLVALFPEHGMLYMMLFTLFDQAFFWTFGIWLSTARDREVKLSPKNMLTPNIIAMLLALLFVIAGIELPAVFMDTLGTVSNATSAMSMMYLGAMICFSPWTQVIRCKELYVGIIAKMILVPIVGGHVLMLFGLPADMMVSMVIIMSLPVMTVVPMIASMNSNEGGYATGITVVTLVVSVFTIPLVQLLAFM